MHDVNYAIFEDNFSMANRNMNNVNVICNVSQLDYIFEGLDFN